MTVFKCYMKILKNNIGLVSIYLVIFFSIAMALQASARKDHLEDFEKTRIDLAIADQDDSTLLTHQRIILKPSIMYMRFPQILLLCRKSFFYRNAEYIVQIPKDFYKTCIVQDKPYFRHKDSRILYFILCRPADQCMAE